MSGTPFLSSAGRGSVAALGEGRLIASIRGWLGSSCPESPAGIGDDCAVLLPARGRELLTVDPVILGVHFDGTVPATRVGAKLMNRNLSDIAAMGGVPRFAVVALALDGRTSVRWLSGFFRGLARAAAEAGVLVVGGDVAELPGSLAATLTLSGEARGRVLTRKGARIGDAIFVTGSLGRSLPSGHHHSFTPRLREGAWLARRGAVRSMLDVSDGLAKDLRTLEPPGAEAALEPGRIPRRAGASLHEALSDGEDYQLLFSVAGGSEAALERAWKRAFPGTRLSRIGRFVRRGQRQPGTLTLHDYSGYEHLR
jgi:thiamine-monophosphate kinase